MSVSRLPDFTHPARVSGRLPSGVNRPRKIERGPRFGKGGVFQHATPHQDTTQRARETTLVIAGAIVFSAPARIVDLRKWSPQLARRMRNNLVRPGVEPRIPGFVPRINIIEAEVTAVSLDEQGRNQRSRRPRWRSATDGTLLPVSSVLLWISLRFPPSIGTSMASCHFT